MTISIIPKLGNLLRTIITNAGYRRCMSKLGIDKDIDDLAIEARLPFDLMQSIEDVCIKQLASDCGVNWTQFLNQVWIKTKASIQQLARDVDIGPISDECGREELHRSYVIPMLSSFISTAHSMHPGPITENWWGSPVHSWIKWASEKASIDENFLLTRFANHLNVDQRTIERWLNGEPIHKLYGPYRPIVRISIGDDASKKIGESGIDQLTAWLILAVTFQSIPPDIRDQVKRYFSLNKQHSWSLGQVIDKLNLRALESGARDIRTFAIPIINNIEALFGRRPFDNTRITNSLHEFQGLINQETEFWQRNYQYIHDWFSARHAALIGNETEALKLYESAVDGAWWFAGPNQHPIINEALLFAVGVGHKVAAEHYWDMTFMLGLNSWPKRELDEQECRRLAFGFEKMFYPQKAHDRVLSNVEVIIRDDEYKLSPKDLTNANAKVKYAEGRTRRTPLMDAVREGKVSDVQQLIEAGGNPDDFIRESGEGPLSYAMRRACDRKDPLIMEYLLQLDLLPETVNRPASTRRETPLKMAIEMADPKAVDRLIELGAKVEVECDYLPSALCYAVNLLYGSIHRNDRTQQVAYMAGKGRADVFDAKRGATLDMDLAARRQALLGLRHASPRHEEFFDAVMDYFIRPSEDYRNVIQVLLSHHADPNRRYKVESQDIAEWTPTLFAAQIGDLEVFTRLLENGGDPELTLMQSSSLERHDALWIAVGYGRHAIVNYLTQRAMQPI
jgi:ankyrin repeat protein